MTPENLTEDQLQWKGDAWTELLRWIEDGIITRDESFVFQYDPEEKQ
jgi:hypothetical protein